MRALIAFLLLYSSHTIACQYSSNSHELAGALEDREEMRFRSGNLAVNSDAIFIGTVRTVDKNSVVFEDIVQLKGKTREGEKFTWSTPEEIIAGCSGLSDFENLETPRNETMTAYLVYAKNGKLLRINEVGSFAERPSGYEEVEWLLQTNHIKTER